MGSNIQGPSVIRVPGWVKNPLGRYYCYFADHKGSFIRLAYADAPEGPWTVHGPGSLMLATSLFPIASPPVPADRPQSDRLEGVAPPGTPGFEDPLADATTPHIASPDVHADEKGGPIVMYFHGLAAFGVQRSRVALSEDGLQFKALPDLLGPSYFRVFRHGGWTYALAMPGILLRSRDGLTGFERGPILFPGTQRHTALRRRGDTLHVFWTRVGDTPESILLSTVDLTGDWMSWRATGETVLLRPETPWEGADLPLERSWRGAINHPVNQLRDPCILEDEGRILLFYAVQGEAGIAVAELTEA